MTYNEVVIRERIEEYKELYFKEFGVYPTSAFSYTRWLSENFLQAHTFTMYEFNIAKELLN